MRSDYVCSKGMSQVSCVPAGRRTEAVFWGQFSLCRARGESSSRRNAKGGKAHCLPGLSCRDSAMGGGCSGRTFAWRRISALKATEWRKETQNGTEQGRLVEQRHSPGVRGDLPKTLKNLPVVIKGGPFRARRRPRVKLLLASIETLG